ncbi:hypothetical protein CEXT_169941, partial [Caerostris extrusa]
GRKAALTGQEIKPNNLAGTPEEPELNAFFEKMEQATQSKWFTGIIRHLITVTVFLGTFEQSKKTKMPGFQTYDCTGLCIAIVNA